MSEFSVCNKTCLQWKIGCGSQCKFVRWVGSFWPFTDKAQIALFKDPVRTAQFML